MYIKIFENPLKKHLARQSSVEASSGRVDSQSKTQMFIIPGDYGMATMGRIFTKELIKKNH